MPVDHPVEPVTGDVAVADRVCGRCRKVFPGDVTLNPAALQEWWACDPCREIMFG